MYLLHFSQPYKHAQHYIGYSQDVHYRVELHRQGKSRVALTRAAASAGIELCLVAVWEGYDRTFERKLKNTRNARRWCPECAAEYRRQRRERQRQKRAARRREQEGLRRAMQKHYRWLDYEERDYWEEVIAQLEDEEYARAVADRDSFIHLQAA